MADGDDKEMPASDLTEEMKRKVAAAVNTEMHDFEKNFIKRSKAHMENLVILAPDIARATKAAYDAFMKAGFDENKAFALTMEMTKGRGLIGY